MHVSSNIEDRESYKHACAKWKLEKERDCEEIEKYNQDENGAALELKNK